MITFTVDDKTKAKSAALGPAVEKAINNAVALLAYGALADAQKSIQKGAKTGRTYKRRNVTHQASAPGEAPASDTGRLVASGRVDQPETFVANMVFSAQNAGYLEYGTRRMAARPFMRPAGEAQRDKAKAIFDKEIAKVPK